MSMKGSTPIPQGCWDMKTSYPHIPLSAIPAVENFKYRGADNSYLYVYFFSPLAERFSECLPSWLAPNVITTIGFLLNIISHIVILSYQGCSFEGHIPNWVCIMTGVFYFIYIFLDNTDGKQARRTGSSSVLGMLFDHGCDCYTTAIIMVNAAKILQIGDNYFALFSVLVVTVPFYFASLEAYYIGGVYLPEINAVTDGSVLYMALCIVAVVAGEEWLKTPILYDLRPAQLAAICLCAASCIFNSLNIYGLYFKEERVREPNNSEVRNALVYVFLTTITIFVCSIYTSGNILQNPLVVCYLYGLLLCRPCIFMQLYLVTGQPLILWRRTATLSLFIIICMLIIGLYVPISFFTLSCVYWGLTLINLLAALHMIYFTLLELKIILDIDIFSIEKQVNRNREIKESDANVQQNKSDV